MQAALLAARAARDAAVHELHCAAAEVEAMVPAHEAAVARAKAQVRAILSDFDLSMTLCCRSGMRCACARARSCSCGHRDSFGVRVGASERPPCVGGADEPPWNPVCVSQAYFVFVFLRESTFALDAQNFGVEAGRGSGYQSEQQLRVQLRFGAHSAGVMHVPRVCNAAVPARAHVSSLRFGVREDGWAVCRLCGACSDVLFVYLCGFVLR